MKKIQFLFARAAMVLPVLLAALVLTTCSDALLEPEQKPDHILLAIDELGLFIDGEVELNLEIVDKRGNPIENIPAWIDTVVTSTKNIVKYENGKIVAVNPGKGKVNITVGDFFESISVRVTPRLYMTQSTQNLNRDVKMVAGRDGVVRLFLKKEESSIAQGDISVELYQNGSLVKTLDFPAQDLNLRPVNDNFSTVALPVSGEDIQPGLSVLVKSASGQTYPASPVAVEVVTVPEFHIRLIPIHSSATGKTGDVNSQNADEYMEALRDMFPLNEDVVDLHAPVTIDVDPVTNQNNFYSVALDHMRATWLAEGSPDFYYYGVIPQEVGGIVGLGYVDNPQPHVFRQAVGWDYPGYEYRSTTMAHELGHNMGRNHAPCGGPASPDPLYPYFNASIGVFGYEVDRGDLKNPSVYKDLMSYCDPEWISDYTYKAIMEFRFAADNVTPNKEPQDVLLLWGRMTNDKLVLEPAFRIKTRSFMPQKSGPYTLSGFDKNGNQLFSYSFAGIRVADALNGTRHFAFTIPVDRVNINMLHTIQLSGPGLKAMQRAATPSKLANANQARLLTGVSARRVSSNMVSLQWKNNQYKMTLVKDAQTGEVIGFTSGGVSEIKTDAKELKVFLSDGVHTATKTISVQ